MNYVVKLRVKDDDGAKNKSYNLRRYQLHRI